MYRNKFLDSWDEKCFELIIYLNNNSNNCAKESCSTALGISPKTLLKICDTLAEIADETKYFELINSQNRLEFKMDEHVNLTNIFFFFLSRSFKYTLIANLFNQTELQTIKLESDLGISHATFYRKIDDLNEILANFKLKFSSKGLRGSELQIRHFLVEYCMTTIPYKVAYSNLNDEKSTAAIKLFEEIFSIQLDADAKLKMLVYLHIIKNRYELNKIDTNKLHEQFPFFENFHDTQAAHRFVNAYQDSELFQIINGYLNEVDMLFKIQMSPEESILLLLFVMGDNIFPVGSEPFIKLTAIQAQSESPIDKAIIEITNVLHQNQLIDTDNFILENDIRDLLNINFWNQIIYYGGIYMYADLSFDQLINLNRFKAVQSYLLNFFIDSHAEFKGDELQNRRFIVNLLLIFLHAANNSSKSFKVGVVVRGDIMYRMLIQKQIINRINSLGYASAEKYNSATDYDLLVSNVELPEFEENNDNFYLLNHQFTPHDFSILEQIIDKNAKIKKTSE